MELQALQPILILLPRKPPPHQAAVHQLQCTRTRMMTAKVKPKMRFQIPLHQVARQVLAPVHQAAASQVRASQGSALQPILILPPRKPQPPPRALAQPILILLPRKPQPPPRAQVQLLLMMKLPHQFHHPLCQIHHLRNQKR